MLAIHRSDVADLNARARARLAAAGELGDPLLTIGDDQFAVKAQTIDNIVKGTVLSSPWLDHVWLPGRYFDALWNWTRDTVDPGRLAKLKFSYTGKYERLGLADPPDDDDDLGAGDDDLEAKR